MPGPFSSILRGTNRSPHQPLTITMLQNPSPHQTILANLAHRFFILPAIKPQAGPPINYPDNCQVLAAPITFRPDMAIDLIISFGRAVDWQPLAELAKRSGCPLICLEQEVPPPRLPERQLNALRKMGGEHCVFGSDVAARGWGYGSESAGVTTIHAPIDTDIFIDWRGGDGKILTVVDGYTQRAEAGFDLWRTVTQGLPVNPVGNSPGFSEAAKTLPELANAYRRASVFLHTEDCLTTPVALLRAMAVGCPVVARRSPIVEEFVEDGVNGYLVSGADEMRSRLEILLDDPDLAKSLGGASRQTIVGSCDKGMCRAKWVQVLTRTVDQQACTWMEKYDAP